VPSLRWQVRPSLKSRSRIGAGNPKPADQAPPGTTNWGGLGWGIGVATDFDIGGKRVANASIVNGSVRVSDTSSNVGIGFVLEAHYFFRAWQLPFVKNGCGPHYLGTYTFPCTDAAIGPFVAIEVGGGTAATPAANGPITAFAMGGMIGFRHLSGLVTEKNATSVGISALVCASIRERRSWPMVLSRTNLRPREERP
jgi:hypothetical protein